MGWGLKLYHNMGDDGGDSGDVSDSGVGDGVSIQIRCSNGSKFTVRTHLESTVGAFKALVAQNCDVPANQQRLIYKGRILKNDQTLESYGLQGENTVHLVRGFVPDASANTAGVATSGPGGPNTTPGIGRGVGSNESGEFGASMFPELGGNGLGGSGVSGLFGAGLPGIEQVQQQLARNPNLISEMMNMPVIQNLLNNPDIIHNMIMNNPRMREVIDRNPELAHILNDRRTLQEALENARNPELMREMMRNSDRAMSNIESSPEGFNMLRRMYENVQEPLLNATTMAGDSGNRLGSNPFSALLGSQGGDQVQDRSTTTLTVDSDTNTGSPTPNSNPLPNPWSSIAATGGAQTNTAPSSNPAGGATVPGIGGLGGLGLPETDRMFDGMLDPSLMIQFLQNPAVSQMMQNLASNPQYVNQMLDSNPQWREAMQNPEILRQLTSPEALQQLLALHQSLSSLFGGQQSSQEIAQNGGGTGLELLMNMFSGIGTVGNTSNVPPEELYATQLSQLQEMGFIDTRENIQALRATSGNVHAAVERLLGNLGQ